MKSLYFRHLRLDVHREESGTMTLKGKAVKISSELGTVGPAKPPRPA